MNLVKEHRLKFRAIAKHTKFCAKCGQSFNMKKSGHNHFPFCEKCRGAIIKETFNTVEKKSPKGKGKN